MGILDSIFKAPVSRRRFLQATAAAGAAGAAAGGVWTLREVQAQAKPAGATTITKSICHHCPARCGIDVYTTDGRVHAIYRSAEHPISNGKLCPKGPLGTYILYDPDRFKGPMKRTNPKKGRNEDPKFVPISWDEALKTVADRLGGLRDKGESHRFALCFGRGDVHRVGAERLEGGGNPLHHPRALLALRCPGRCGDGRSLSISPCGPLFRIVPKTDGSNPVTGFAASPQTDFRLHPPASPGTGGTAEER